MGEVINLRRARKAKQRKDSDTAASANRAAFGRSKSERQETAMRATQAERLLDGHVREPPAGDDA